MIYFKQSNGRGNVAELDSDSVSGSGAHRGLFLGESPAALDVRRLIKRAAQVDATVLITGESGVGKELVAREIHARSGRRRQPFIPLNCAAIPDTLIESELFGHEAGAYTDARDAHRGAFELAHQGTLFLDEVGDLSLNAQPKLLRSLESGEIVRVGGGLPRPVDLRIVAATNHNLKRMCKEQRFRTDLYYRLRVLRIKVPPLRDRLGDVPMLASHFARLLAERVGRDFTEIDPTAREYLMSYHWPGNVRELRSVVEQAMAMSSGCRLDASCFELDPISMPGYSFGSLLERDWKKARSGFEAAYAKRLLNKHQGNVQEAAKDAGMATGSFYKMLRRLGLSPRESS
jgi:transcriptional regulator with PAS, ATPase and Fis domain